MISEAASWWRRAALVGVAASLLGPWSTGGCTRRRRPPPAPAAPAPAPDPVEDEPEPEPEARLNADDLLPGAEVAFGLPIPQGSTVRFSSDALRVFYLPASMPRVMRYLERQLIVRNAEVMALGAMLRGARLREDTGDRQLDVGVRDEGGVCVVTVWDRTPPPPAQLPPGAPSSDTLQRQGLDPATGRPGRTLAY